MTYIEKLRDVRWQKKRLKIFERDDWVCAFCRNGWTFSEYGPLDVHHLKYIRGLEPWDYDDKYLITLCHVHHNDDHITDGRPITRIITEVLHEGRCLYPQALKEWSSNDCERIILNYMNERFVNVRIAKQILRVRSQQN